LEGKKPRTKHARESKVKLAGNKFLLQSGLAGSTVYDKEELFEQLDKLRYQDVFCDIDHD
jgi:hypothetical protein